MKVIRSSTVVSFLQLKGWEILPGNHWYIRCKAPEELGLRENQIVKVPLDRFQGAPFFTESMDVILQIISVAYQKPIPFYRSLFSLPLSKINEQMVQKDAISKETMELITTLSA